MSPVTYEPFVLRLLERLLSSHGVAGVREVRWDADEYAAEVRSFLMSRLSSGAPPADAAWETVRNTLAHSDIVFASSATGEQVVAELKTSGRQRVDSTTDWLVPVVEHSTEGPDLEAATAIASSLLGRLAQDGEVLGKIHIDEAARLGLRAAEEILAAARWARVVGDRLDTTAVTRLLGISRQALAKRQAAGSLLGLAGEGTTWFPTWQFDADAGEIRPEVRDIIGAFRDRLDNVDPLLVAAWATTPQDEDLAGHTPADWVRAGRDADRLRVAAERAASRLAR